MLATLAAVVLAAGCASSRPSRTEAVMGNLESQLYSGDSKTASRAALVLLSYESDDAFKLVKKGLADSSPSTTRAAIITAFTSLHDTRIRQEALGFLNDDSEEIVTLAQTYLSDVIGKPAAPDVLNIAKDSRRSVRERIAALKILGKIGTPSTVEGLLDLLEDGDGKIVAATTASLQSITRQPFDSDPAAWRSWYRQNRRLPPEEWQRVGDLYTARTQQLDSRIASLQSDLEARDHDLIAAYKQCVGLAIDAKRYDLVIGILNDARPSEAKVYAAEALGKAKAAEAAPALIQKASVLDVKLAKACVDALGAIADPKAAQVVALNLTAGDLDLRLSAVEAYWQLPSSDLSLLMPLRSDPSPDVRAAVMKAFGNRQYAEGYNALVGALSDQSNTVRTAAAGALGMLGNKTAVLPLIGVIKDESDKVRWAVVMSLSQLGDPSSYDALIEATKDDVPGVKQAAVVALAKLGDKRAVDRLLEMTLMEPTPLVADQAWTSLVELVRNDEPLILTLAEKLEQTGRFNRAESILKSLADSTQTSDRVLEARMRLAKGYLAAGNFQGAAAYYRKVLDVRADDKDALTGLGLAFKGQGDWASLAGLYSRPIIAGQATPDIKQDYLTGLRELASAKDYASVVASARQVLGFDLSSDKDFATALTEIYDKALPLYIKSLVAALDSQDEVARTAARNALSGYGRTAGNALVDGLVAQSTDVRSASLLLLMPLSGGHDFGFDPKKDPSGQEGAIAQWRTWLSGPQTQ